MSRSVTTRRFAFYVLPSIWRTCLAFGVLPLTTYRLEPADFGLLALVLSLAGLGAGASGLGAAYSLARHLPVLDHRGQRDLMSTLFCLGLLAGATMSIIVWLAWQPLVALLPDLSRLSSEVRWITCALIVLGIPWNHAMAFISITGRAAAFATTTIAESIATAAATLTALYAFDLGGESLLIGALAGGITNALGSIIVLRHYLVLRVNRVWLAECLHVGGLSFVGSLIERGQVAVERYALARYVGLAPLGIYSHSQQYQNLAKMGTKAVTNAAWPVALEEARTSDLGFPKVARIWSLAQLMLGLGGIFMATLGRDAIALLTHDKFTPAYVFAALWFMLVLLENSGKSAVALVYANGLGISNQWIVIIGGLLATASMIPLVFWFGVFGAVLGNLISIIVYRISVVVLARRIVVVPFQDWGVVAGIATIVLALFCSVFLADSMLERSVVLVLTAAMLVGSSLPALSPIMHLLKRQEAA